MDDLKEVERGFLVEAGRVLRDQDVEGMAKLIATVFFAGKRAGREVGAAALNEIKHRASGWDVGHVEPGEILTAMREIRDRAARELVL